MPIPEPFRSPARPTGLLQPDDPVFEGVPQGPRYGQRRWDLRSLTVRESQGERYLDFTTIPASYRGSVRDALVIFAQPTNPDVVTAGVVRRGRPASAGSLVTTFHRLRAIAKWGERQALPDLPAWTQRDADRFVAEMRTGVHREGGVALSPESIRPYVAMLKLLREFAPAMPGGGLSFQPWGARSAPTVAGGRIVRENVTSPLPWETWAPAIAGAWAVVDAFSPDILAAMRTATALPKTPRGPSGNNAWRRVKEWADSGGILPLQTGFGRITGNRGEPNVRLLCRKLGIHDGIFNRANGSYRPDAIALTEEMADDPARSAFGGLVLPTVTISLPDGTDAPWVAEIGSGEAEYLASVLRGACYVLLAALTGMRDSEIQALTKGSVTTRDGLPAVLSRQYKGSEADDGTERGWWAPRPVIRTVEVLTALSPHATYLLARSSTNFGSYVPQRDIPRLIHFINAEPATRVGRGRGLGLERIQDANHASINGSTLRRSFAVFAATRPGAELGLGIQLGHAAWRTTTGYIVDGQEHLAKMVDDERRNIMRQQASALILGTAPVGGNSGSTVRDFRAQVITDPRRAARLTDQLAERLHFGTTNDCMYDAATAACGPDGPFLSDHVCAGGDCGNALYTTAHKDVLEGHVNRIDKFLDRGRGSAVLVQQMRRSRARLVELIRELSSATTEEATS